MYFFKKEVSFFHKNHISWYCMYFYSTDQNKFYTIIFESKSLVPFDNNIYFLTKAKSFENLSEKQLLYMLHVC